MNHFLTDPVTHRKKFEAFEIEKNNFNYVFEVKIYGHLEPLKIKVNKEQRCVHVQVEPFVCDFSPSYQEKEEIYFSLPSNVAADNYHKSEEHKVTCLTFFKRDLRSKVQNSPQKSIFDGTYF